MQALDSNIITDSTATGANVEHVAAVFGKAHQISQGKMVRKKVHSTQRVRRFVIPSALLKHYPTDELDIDFFYIQGAPYLLTKSKSIKFQSIQSFNRISKRNRSTGRITYKCDTNAIVAGLYKVLQAYATRGF